MHIWHIIDSLHALRPRDVWICHWLTKVDDLRYSLLVKVSKQKKIDSYPRTTLCTDCLKIEFEPHGGRRFGLTLAGAQYVTLVALNLLGAKTLRQSIDSHVYGRPKVWWHSQDRQQSSVQPVGVLVVVCFVGMTLFCPPERRRPI